MLEVEKIMKFMGANELRESFISFFESKEHLRMESFPLVYKNHQKLELQLVKSVLELVI